MPDPIARLNAALQDRYHVERELGAGGMATVYLARDLRHERRVAVKVLKPELAAAVGPDRFLTEIKTTAGLQHPNILPLHDSGEADGFLFYVMPYVEGESLRTRLEREHQLPVAMAVGMAAAVAEALDYAHRRGVIHRDIKPANILLQDGKPVIADFGIALALGAAAEGRVTATGSSLGTPYYMSPEQAAGERHVGPATDIFSLGCVLYEMLVGEPPFRGSTAQGVLGRILSGDPPSAGAERAATPANVDAAIRCALQKIPADRFVTARDFASALGDPAFRRDVASGAPGAEASKRWTAAPWVAATALSLAAAGALAAVHFGEPPAADRPLRYTIALPWGEDGQGRFFFFRMSPDGQYIAVNGVTPEHDGVFVRRLTSLEWTYLNGTAGASDMLWAPDSRTLAFFTAGSLQAVSVDGGPTRELIPLEIGNYSASSGSWGRDGVIVFRQPSRVYLSTLSETGGGPSRLPSSVPDGAAPRYPHFLPNGRDFLYTVTGPEPGIFLASLDEPEGARLLPDPSSAVYLEPFGGRGPGHLLFARDGRLIAQPFDARTGSLRGDALTVADRVLPMGHFAAAVTTGDGGIMAYLDGSHPELDSRLLWVDRSGATTSAIGDPGPMTTVSLSPDGRRVARLRSGDVWALHLERGEEDPVSFGQNLSLWTNAVWAPDGDRLVYPAAAAAGGDGGAPVFTLHLARRSDPGRADVLYRGPIRRLPTDWTPEGDLLYTEQHPQSGADLWVMAVGAAADVVGDPVPIRTDDFSTSFGTVSPDGRWLAYVSDETGESQIWVQRYPAGGERWRVSASGASAQQPRWSGDGRELYFLNDARGSVMVVSFAPDAPGGGATPPRPLFQARLNFVDRQWAALYYDVSPDGRFLINAIPDYRQPSLHVLTGWEQMVEGER